MEIIINHPYTEAWQGHITRNFLPTNRVTLPSRKSPGISALTHNQHISPPCSRPTWFQTWTLNHLCSATVNNRHCSGIQPEEAPDRPVCVAVDLSAASDTVCHNNLLSTINRSQVPPATAWWLSSYLRGRQANTCFRWVKSTYRKVNTGVPQGSKLSPSLFSFYIANMPRPTDLVKRVCYADDLTVWANIRNLEVNLNNYLEEIRTILHWFPPQSLQSRCSPQTHTKPRPILVYSSRINTCRWLNALGYWWSIWTPPYHSTSTSSMQQRERVSGRNNILKALAGTSRGQQKEILLMTYKAVGRSIINYAAPVWSPNLHTNNIKIQCTQKEALRIATGCYKMYSIDHLHTEADMLKVREHSEILYAQYLARCGLMSHMGMKRISK